MARKKPHEDHVNHEAWAIPYGDLVTLLLAFFVVMYAVSSVNTSKYEAMANSLHAAFSGSPRTITPIQLGKTQQQGSNYDAPNVIAQSGLAAAQVASPMPVKSLSPYLRLLSGQPSPAAMQQAQRQLHTIASELEKELAPLIDKNLITVRRTELWIEVEINSDILFSPGSAVIDNEARETLTRLANVLAVAPNIIRVEGHTDNQPINTAQFPSNWELSASRAINVVHLFVKNKIQPERLNIVGFGEFRPRAPNDTVEGRNSNRRVVLIILADTHDEAMNLASAQAMTSAALGREVVIPNKASTNKATSAETPAKTVPAKPTPTAPIPPVTQTPPQPAPSQTPAISPPTTQPNGVH